MKLLIFLARYRLKREITDIKYCTVSRKTRLNTCRNGRSEITSDSGRTYENYLGLELVDNR